MTPEALSALHGKAFAPERGWSPTEFADLLAAHYVTLLAHPHGFALTRTVTGEAELLTLAVDPTHRRQGIATQLVARWLSACDADAAFLEVAADNHAAQALYAAHGFAQAGIRRAYYTRPSGPPVDAVIMRALLTPRHPAETPVPSPKSS
jgi:ribosomal-protein-alanine N-acetyltransferase